MNEENSCTWDESRLFFQHPLLKLIHHSKRMFWKTSIFNGLWRKGIHNLILLLQNLKPNIFLTSSSTLSMSTFLYASNTFHLSSLKTNVCKACLIDSCYRSFRFSSWTCKAESSSMIMMSKFLNSSITTIKLNHEFKDRRTLTMIWSSFKSYSYLLIIFIFTWVL